MIDFLVGENTLTELEVKNLNVQSLAFVGDSVHTLFVRSKLLLKNDVKSSLLHKKANNFVRASGQSLALNKLVEFFTPDELDIYKRARNYKTQNQAKGATLADYKKATGFEAVIGYLFITNKKERLLSLLQKSYEFAGKENQ